MASLRHQLWLPATTNAVVLSFAGGSNGIASRILGDDESPAPPAKDAPWLYLEIEPEAEAFSGSDFYVEGLFRWRAYDDPAANYTRMRRMLVALVRTYPREFHPDGEDWYADDDTGEAIIWLGPGILGPETEDRDEGLLQQWAQWPFRKITRGGQDNG